MENHISVLTFGSYPNAYLIHRGARVCLGKGPMENINDIDSYLGRLARMGHESIMEHSNLIFLLKFSKESLVSNIDHILQMMENAHFFYIHTSIIDGEYNILFAGSVRAYLHLMRESKDTNNEIYHILKKVGYENIERSLLTNLIDNGLMDKDLAIYKPVAKVQDIEEDDLNKEELSVDAKEDIKEIKGKYVDLISYQDPFYLYKELSKYGFSLKDVLESCTITLLFHDVSRSCANQMTRHRVAISQESQRYCTHIMDKDRGFVNPVNMNLENRYKDLDKSVVDLANNIDPFESYSKLLENGIVKEDARAWLPMNSTTQLLMTFTYAQLFHFLKIRSEKGAQLEIRNVANGIRVLLEKYIFHNGNLPSYIEEALTPNTIKKNNDIVLDIPHSSTVDDDVENIKSLDINSLEDAEKLMNTAQEYSNL